MIKDCVLALELSTSTGSVAVAVGNEVIFESVFQANRSHNALLFAPLRQALAVAGDRLQKIVVGTGPGSYTGVRIAIAAAQGLSLSKKVPVEGLSSLIGCLESNTFGVVGNARRGRFYLAVIRDAQLHGDITLMEPDALQRAMQQAGVDHWVSCDAVPPIEGIQLAQPDAGRLALRTALDSPAPPDEKALEPIYLEGAFITQARPRAAPGLKTSS